MRHTALLFPILLFAFALCGSAGSASAQTRVSGGQFRQHTVVDDTLLRKGRMELALSLAAMYSSNTVSISGTDESSTQKNTYVNPALIVGYMVTDAIEVRLSLGGQYLGSSISNGELSQSALSGVAAVQGLYQRDFVNGLAGYAGVGAGGYYGYRNVPSPDNASLNLRFNHVGGLGQALVGLMMQPSARLLLRGGMRLDMLFGSESPADDDLASTMGVGDSHSTFNVQVLAELSIGWRFL